MVDKVPLKWGPSELKYFYSHLKNTSELAGTSKRSHLSASFNPLLEEITKTRKSDRDGAVGEEQLVTGEGGPQPTPRLRPAL